MRRSVRSALALTLAVAATELSVMPVNAAAPRTTYFACRASGILSSISVLPHNCAAGFAKVSGKFAGTDFRGANFQGANLTNATLKGAVVAYSSSGHIVGQPASLPSGWRVSGGYLLGPTAHLAGADLHNLNLTGANLGTTDLTGANLSGANLARVNLNHAVLTNATLTHVSSGAVGGTPAALPSGWALTSGFLLGATANLSGADLSGLDFTNADLSSADLSDSTLTGATVTGANFATAMLSGVTSGALVGQPASLPAGWVLAKSYLVGAGAVLSGADLSGEDLTSANLAGTNFFGADLTNADLSNTNMSEASLSMATVTGTKFAGANFHGLITSYEVGTPASLPTGWQALSGPYQGGYVQYFVGASASIGGAQLSGVVFAGMDLSGVYIPGGHLVGTDFSGATVVQGNLASANLGQANFSGANMSGTNFTSADLSGANFTGANFTGANFTGARLLSVSGRGSATFTGATCPDGVVYGQLGANC